MTIDKSIPAYDLGNFHTTDSLQKVSINEIIKVIRGSLFDEMLNSVIDLCGVNITLVNSKTYGKGQRLWFKCPICSKRKGLLYKHATTVACRRCFGLKYKKQRYKGMIESTLLYS